MEEEKEEDKNPLKYRYVEEFEESIDPETGKPYDDVESPTVVDTELWGKIELHRIAKVKWEEMVYTVEYDSTDSEGNTKTEEYKIKVFEERMGEPGGWIESKENLSQKGKCWVGKDAVVLGKAIVREDALVEKGAEIGDRASVYGEAVVSGPVGIGGDAQVCGKADIGGDREELGYDMGGKWKKGTMRKRLAVSGNAKVKGTVKGTAKVYGEAEVGEYALIDGEAKVYDHAYVGGIKGKSAHVGGKTVAYWHSVTEGEAMGTDKGTTLYVGGSVRIGVGGKVKGTVSLRGTVYVLGKIEGEFHFDGQYLFLGEGCTINGVESLKAPRLSHYLGWTGYHNGAGVVRIEGGCTLTNCGFTGNVNLKNVDAKGCRFEDCTVEDSKLSWVDVRDSIVKSATMSDCYLICAQTAGECNVKEVTVNHGVIPEKPDWEDVRFSGITEIKKMKGMAVSGVTTTNMEGFVLGSRYCQDGRYDEHYYYDSWLGAWRAGSIPVGRDYRKNYVTATVAKTFILTEAPWNNPKKFPPTYNPPTAGHVFGNNPNPNTADAKYDAQYDKILKAWKQANTKKGKIQKEREDRYNEIQVKIDELDAVRAALSAQYRANPTTTLSEKISRVSWARNFVYEMQSLIKEKMSGEVWGKIRNSALGVSYDPVKVNSPFKIVYVVNEGKIEEFYLADYRKGFDIPAFSKIVDGQRYETLVNGIHVGSYTAGGYHYTVYVNRRRPYFGNIYRAGSIQWLLDFIELYGGYDGIPYHDEVNPIYVKDLNDEYSDLESRISDPDISEETARQLSKRMEAIRKEYRERIHEKESEENSEAYWKKYDEAKKYERKCQDEFDEKREVEEYKKARKTAIRYVSTLLSSCTFIDGIDGLKRSALQLKAILEELMTGEVKDTKAVEALTDKARLIKEQHDEAKEALYKKEGEVSQKNTEIRRELWYGEDGEGQQESSTPTSNGE